MPGTNEPVVNADQFLRRFIDDGNSVTYVDNDPKKPRPSGGAYVYDVDGVSGYLLSVMLESGLTAVDVVAAGRGTLCFSLPVGGIRACENAGADVVRDPDDPIDRARLPLDDAHALISLPEDVAGKRRRRFLRKLATDHATLVYGTPIGPAPGQTSSA